MGTGLGSAPGTQKPPTGPWLGTCGWSVPPRTGSDPRRGLGSTTPQSPCDGFFPPVERAPHWPWGARKDGTGSPSCSAPACPLVPRLHCSPQAHPILCQPQLSIMALSWSGLGSGLPIPASLPLALGCGHRGDSVGDRGGDGDRDRDGDRDGGCIHLGLGLGLSHVSRAGPHPPARCPQQWQCHCTGVLWPWEGL